MNDDFDSVITVSIILNLVKDGRADLAALSPFVQDYIRGMMADYEESDDEEKKMLYWFAHDILSKQDDGEIKGMLH